MTAAPCLYCGCPDTWLWEPGPGLYAIACYAAFCAATGPVRSSEAEATAAWNAPPRDRG